MAEIDDELFRLITGEPRVMPHLHLSLQAGDDMVLKRMKRRHTRAQAIAFCHAVRARRPEVAFGADLIAGFPTESDAMFENTLAMVAEAGLTWLHVFPYSARPGTPAAKMPAVPGDIVKARAARLRAAGEAARDRFLDTCIGGTEPVLVEQPGLGRTPRYAHVALSGTAETGTWCRCASPPRATAVWKGGFFRDATKTVMRGLDPRIHAFFASPNKKERGWSDQVRP